MLFLHRTSLGEQSSLVLQLDVVLQVLPILSSNPMWLVLFPLGLGEGEIQWHLLVNRVGMDHLPTLVLPMQWRLHDWNEGPIVPLRV